MKPEPAAGDANLGKLIKAVAQYGEQARLLALNLTVVAEKLKPYRGSRRPLDDDLFSLVTRTASVSRQVAQIAAVAERGLDRIHLEESDRLLRLLLEKGVFSAEVIDHLERSLLEVLALAQKVARQIGVELPESCPNKPL